MILNLNYGSFYDFRTNTIELNFKMASIDSRIILF